jgi:hypothetical protein
MGTLATSYEGFWLMLQFPFSLLAALISLGFAFARDARTPSCIAASVAILFSAAGVWKEHDHYGWSSFTTDHSGGLLVMFAPPILAVAIILFGSRRTMSGTRPNDESHENNPR